MNHKLVDERVTLICELGCTRVREVISDLQQGRTSPEIENTRPEEQAQILLQLQTIMAVYDTSH